MDLFSPLRLRSVTVRNRIAVSPMCQYRAEDGRATEWHLVHLGSRAVGGAGLVLSEAAAVLPGGRISPHDLGLWEDAQVGPLAQVVRFVEKQGAAFGVQLAHAGRKASTRRPWELAAGQLPVLPPAEGGWQPVHGPSALAFDDGYPVPAPLTADGIAAVVWAFGSAAERAFQAGVRVLEVHAAHGYLLHQFLSPLSNRRDDAYGGSFHGRTRLLLEVVDEVRLRWPASLPLLVRLSVTDWAERGWDVEQSVALARLLRERGVDLVDCSSGGLVPRASVPVGAGYQTAFAARLRAEAGIATGAVGMITSAAQADHVVRTGQADLVLLGRELLRNPYWPLAAAAELGAGIDWPAPYLRARR